MPTVIRNTGAARWWTEKELAGPTRVVTSTFNTQNSQTTLCNNSPDRVNLVITNNGTFNIAITPFPNGSPTTGIILGASGGNVTMNVRDDFELVSQQWFGISVGGATTTTVIETLADIQLPTEQTILP